MGQGSLARRLKGCLTQFAHQGREEMLVSYRSLLLAVLVLVATDAMASQHCVYDEKGAAQALQGPPPPEPPPTHPAVLDERYNQHFAPCFPGSAYRRGHYGNVLLALFVTGDGLIRKVEIERSSGYTELDSSALDAARHWRALAPASRDRVTYDSWIHTPVNFGQR